MSQLITKSQTANKNAPVQALILTAEDCLITASSNGSTHLVTYEIYADGDELGKECIKVIIEEESTEGYPSEYKLTECEDEDGNELNLNIDLEATIDLINEEDDYERYWDAIHQGIGEWEVYQDETNIDLWVA